MIESLLLAWIGSPALPAAFAWAMLRRAIDALRPAGAQGDVYCHVGGYGRPIIVYRNGRRTDLMY